MERICLEGKEVELLRNLISIYFLHKNIRLSPELEDVLLKLMYKVDMK